VDPGENHPQRAEQREHYDRVGEPHLAAGIDIHRTHVLSNTRSDARRPLNTNASQRHGPPSSLLLAVVFLLVCGACLPDPQRGQAVSLLTRLSAARIGFATDWPRACDEVGDVQTRLYGEPGLTGVRPAWVELRAAAEALQAVCGQTTLLAAGVDVPRWRAGVDRQLSVACEHLRAASASLDQPPPC
jgi:hypothetical protein